MRQTGDEENLTEKAVRGDDRASGAVNAGLYSLRKRLNGPEERRQRMERGGEIAKQEDTAPSIEGGLHKGL